MQRPRTHTHSENIADSFFCLSYQMTTSCSSDLCSLSCRININSPISCWNQNITGTSVKSSHGLRICSRCLTAPLRGVSRKNRLSSSEAKAELSEFQRVHDVGEDLRQSLSLKDDELRLLSKDKTHSSDHNAAFGCLWMCR